MKTYLYDTLSIHENLLPLSFTRPVADFRVGIVTIKEKWEALLPGDYDFYPVEYLREKFCKDKPTEDEECVFILGSVLPREELAHQISALMPGESLEDEEELIAFRGTLADFTAGRCSSKKFDGEVKKLKYVYDIFLQNYEEIDLDYDRLTAGRVSQPLPECLRFIEKGCGEKTRSRIFIEEGAVVECVSVNVEQGPVYIGRDAILMEGACVRGPLALCEGSEVRMGAKIYGGTTIGPHSKVGGEIDNTVIFGFSNKAHDGYLGNAVVGEWCNIGAGVNASNLKNDYSLIRVWNYATRSFMRTDLQFCGLIMGDHSKIGVNCMVNTATVMGVGVNLHGCGFARTYLPNFSEGSPSAGFTKVSLKKFMEIMERVMSRRHVEVSEADRRIYEEIHEKFA